MEIVTNWATRRPDLSFQNYKSIKNLWLDEGDHVADIIAMDKGIMPMKRRVAIAIIAFCDADLYPEAGTHLSEVLDAAEKRLNQEYPTFQYYLSKDLDENHDEVKWEEDE